MNNFLKGALYATSLSVMLAIMGSCQKTDSKEETVSFYLTYTITTDNGQNMPGTKATSAEVFDEFYQKIKSGDLVAPTYDLVFTEKTTGAVYTVNGTWAGKDMITLRTGNYKVVGTSTATGENIQDKCSLKFEDDIVVDVSSKTITLNAAYDCSLIIFSDASIAKLSNFNGVSSTDLFTFSNYIYAFIHTQLWAEGKQSDAYLAGTHTNGTQFKIYTGNLNYETGKFYVYNDISTAFSLEKMEEGGDEGFPINLSKNGTANCYIVSSAGTYKFKANVKGNSTDALDGTPVKAEILWESFGTDVKPNVGDIIKTASYGDGFVYFATPTELADGNAVIAVKDANGTILWSWHIWVCRDFDPVATGQVYNNNAGTMMDRNLGATSATPGDVRALGLLYQWGRKDPFLSGGQIYYSSNSSQQQAASTLLWPESVNSDNNTGRIEFTISNPTIFIACDEGNKDWLYTGTSSTDNTRWQYNSKTIYDPCPNGWQIPDGGENGIWSSAFDYSSEFYDGPWDDDNKGMNFGSGNGKTLSMQLGSSIMIWYPLAGARSSVDGTLTNVGYYGHCWSCSCPTSDCRAYSFYYYCYRSNSVTPSFVDNKVVCQSVRCKKQ